MSARPDPSPGAPRRLRPAAPAPVLEVVPARTRTARSRRVRHRLMAVAAAGFALATVFGLVLVHVQLTTNEVRLTSLQSDLAQARSQNLKLSLDVARLESPARVVATAQQLGMVAPPSITYLTATGPAAPGPSTAAAGR